MLFFLDVFQYFHGLMLLLLHTENICHYYFLDVLLFFCFLSIHENLYMIHHNLNLSHYTYNTINMTKGKIITFHWFSWSYLIFLKKWIKNSINNFICVIVIHNFYVFPCRILQCFFITIFWWHEVIFHR